jgi:hypothetical protein
MIPRRAFRFWILFWTCWTSYAQLSYGSESNEDVEESIAESIAEAASDEVDTDMVSLIMKVLEDAAIAGQDYAAIAEEDDANNHHRHNHNEDLSQILPHVLTSRNFDRSIRGKNVWLYVPFVS